MRESGGQLIPKSPGRGAIFWPKKGSSDEEKNVYRGGQLRLRKAGRRRGKPRREGSSRSSHQKVDASTRTSMRPQKRKKSFFLKGLSGEGARIPHQGRPAGKGGRKERRGRKNGQRGR